MGNALLPVQRVLNPNPHSFSFFIHPYPSHSLIGAPSFLDGDPCICMSPRGTYAFREEKYPYPCTHMPPVERYASPNKTCPDPPPPLSRPSPSWSTPFIFSIGVLDQPHAYTCRPHGEICVHPPFLDIESMHIHGIYIAARREDMHRSADITHPPVRTSPPSVPPDPPR